MPRKPKNGTVQRTLTMSQDNAEVWDMWVKRIMETLPEDQRKYLTQGRLVVVAIDAANDYLDGGGTIEVLDAEKLSRNPKGRSPHWYRNIIA